MSKALRITDHERKFGKVIGLVRSEGDYRCYECIDFDFYEREINAREAGEKCTYCAGPVWLSPAELAAMEGPKRTVNLAKREVQKFDLLTISHNLSVRLQDVSFAYDKARQEIERLQAEVATLQASINDAGFVETVSL